MKVLHAVGNFPVPPHGGMEATAYHLGQQLAALGVETKVVAASQRAQRVSEGGCEFLGLATGTVSNWIRIPRWSGMRELRQLVEWADIVHVHNPPELFNLGVLEIAWRKHRPVVLSMLSPGALGGHPQRLFRWVGRADDRVLQLAMRRAAFVQVKNTIDLAYVQRFTSRTTVIPDGVDNRIRESPRPDDAKRSSSRPFPNLLFLGRLHPMKGPDQLISALPYVRSRLPGVMASFAGPDSDGLIPSLRRLAQSLGVAESVRFLGTLDESAKISALDEADVVVLPSRAHFAEGFSIVASEAWARGKPVAAYPVGALKARVISGENGALAATDTPQALAEAILQAARLTSVRPPPDVVGWEDVARRFLSVYEGISPRNIPPGAVAPPRSATVHT